MLVIRAISDFCKKVRISSVSTIFTLLSVNQTGVSAIRPYLIIPPWEAQVRAWRAMHMAHHTPTQCNQIRREPSTSSRQDPISCPSVSEPCKVQNFQL